MSIASSDLLFQLSTNAGAAGNSTAQGNPNLSLGKYMSTTALGTGANGMFDDVTGAENAASDVEYRCIFVCNNHATLTAIATVVYIASEVAGGAGVSLAVDPTATSAKGASAAQALTIVDENTAPAGPLTFSSPTTAATGIALGDIPAGSVRAIWVKRAAANTAAVDNDGFTLGTSCDSAA